MNRIQSAQSAERMTGRTDRGTTSAIPLITKDAADVARELADNAEELSKRLSALREAYLSFENQFAAQADSYADRLVLKIVGSYSDKNRGAVSPVLSGGIVNETA